MGFEMWVLAFQLLSCLACPGIITALVPEIQVFLEV
jgi:hypothetical protein